jgi:hypothetical protein
VVRTLLVALGMLATIVAAGFGLQVATLGRPGPARITLVHTLDRLSAFHTSSATIDLTGRRLVASCLDRWIGDSRASVVVLDRHTRLPEIGGHLLLDGPRSFVEFQLAGCPRPLLRWLTTELVQGTPIESRRTTADGQASFLLRLPKTRPALALVISRKTKLPVELIIDGRLRGSSDLAYGAAT